MDKNALIEKLFGLIEPIVKDKGLELYHIEYVKESGENFLRIYIESSEGITLDDCEKVSRPVSDMLDVEEPITESYYLEVSSPGIERILYTDAHRSRYIGREVLVKLAKLHEGKKQYQGSLSGFNESEVNLSIDNINFVIPTDKIKTISLVGDL